MSFLIAAVANKRCLKVECVGTNGAQRPWLALLFAGYAIGDWPESERVHRWVTPVDDAPTDLCELIRFNRDDCSWITLSHDRNRMTLDRSVAARRPTCPILKPLVELYQQTDERRTGVISRRKVRELAAAYDAVLANLKESCWFNKLVRIRAVIHAAANTKDGYLQVG